MRKKVRDFSRKVYDVITRPEMRVLPGQLAFFFVVSLIPLVAVMGAIIVDMALPISTLKTTLLQVVPSDVVNLFITIISGKTINFNLAVFYISAFILASNGPHSMIVASNEIYHIKSAKYLKRRLKAILMTFVVVGLLFFLLVIPVLGESIFVLLKSYATNENIVEFFYRLYQILKYPVAIIVVYFNIKLLYVMAPDKKVRSSTTTNGAIFTTVAWIIATKIFSFYVGRFANYDIFYGSISNILILLLWVYLLSYIFVLGMAFNASNVNDNDIEKTGIIIQEEK